MFQYLEELPLSEAEAIKKTIQALLRQTCILQLKYDPVTLAARDNAAYNVCANHREFISDYLSVLNCELLHDPQDRIFRIAGEGVLTEKMSLNTTRIVILLKMIYRDKIMGEGLRATVTNLAEIREYGKNTNLLPEKLNTQEWYAALNLLRVHQTIELPGAILNVEDQTPIYIYSTINIFCSAADINELVKRYQTQVQELLEEEGEEEVSVETGEEDIYQDVFE